jgi:hypothetical protein
VEKRADLAVEREPGNRRARAAVCAGPHRHGVIAHTGETATLIAYVDAGSPANLTNDKGDTW